MTRIQTVVWHRDEVVKLRVAWASPVTIEFGGAGAADGPGTSEHISNVTLGDSRAWQVAVARDGASLTVRPQADARRPARPPA
jgi:type IV secretory pathway VirB9-like protein